MVVVAALLALVGQMGAVAQVPTAEQLQLLRNMSPEDRAALMESLGLGGGDVGDISTDSKRRLPADESRAEVREPLPEQRVIDQSLKPEDSIIIDIDFRREKPPQVVPQGEGLPPLTIPGEPAPELGDEEKSMLEQQIVQVRSRNPYQLDSAGALHLPGFPPIMLAGLDEKQATHRLAVLGAFIKLDVKVTKLPVRKAGVAGLKPFGYDLFKDRT
jgi:hypothetical protein